MERGTPLTTKNTYSLLHNITTDKHGVPPTKRLFRVTKLDPIPEFICHWGRFGDPGQPIVVRPLQSNMGNGERSRPMGFQLAREHLQSRVKEEDLITDVENTAQSESSSLSNQDARFLALHPFKNLVFNHEGYLNCPHCLWVIRGGETVSNSIFKHDLCKLVIAKMGSAITYDSTRGTESGEEKFKKFANNSGIIGGERFRFNPF
ncbi:hypothetical protein Tco_0909301 [Tanacetum coccineum]|uniref:Uncharacterized protein n=1 Tax=Tanacetum coccineum TaxID=301880 RepID=A0ABQ5CT30_9ASTR